MVMLPPVEVLSGVLVSVVIVGVGRAANISQGRRQQRGRSGGKHQTVLGQNPAS